MSGTVNSVVSVESPPTESVEVYALAVVKTNMTVDGVLEKLFRLCNFLDFLLCNFLDVRHQLFILYMVN